MKVQLKDHLLAHLSLIDCTDFHFSITICCMYKLPAPTKWSGTGKIGQLGSSVRVWIHMILYTRIYIYIYICKKLQEYIYIYTVYVYAYISIYIYIHLLHTYMHMHYYNIYIYMYTYTRMIIYIYIYT